MFFNDNNKNNKELIKTDVESYFPMGRKLSVRRGSSSEYYPSYVKDINNEMLLIDTLISNGIQMSLPPRSVLQVGSVTKEGLWTGECTVHSIAKGSISGLWITLPGYLERLQRREFLRMDFNFEVKLRVMQLNGLEVASESTAKCANLSGGGIAVITKHKITASKKLRVLFSAAGLKVESEIKPVHVQYDAEQKTFLTGFKFIDLETSEINKIHKIVHKKQIDMRRRGLI